jgi:hypothetical protein
MSNKLIAVKVFSENQAKNAVNYLVLMVLVDLMGGCFPSTVSCRLWLYPKRRGMRSLPQEPPESDKSFEDPTVSIADRDMRRAAPSSSTYKKRRLAEWVVISGIVLTSAAWIVAIAIVGDGMSK